MMSLLNPDDLFLYITPTDISVWHWQGRQVRSLGYLPMADSLLVDVPSAWETTRQALNEIISRHPKARYSVVVDVADEEYHQEEIPKLFGKDRRLLMERKLAQRFRASTLKLVRSVTRRGTATEKVRMETILLCGLGKVPAVEACLDILRSRTVRLAGVYGPAFLLRQLKNLPISATRTIIVTLSNAGLRQTVFKDGRLRFSRLTSYPPGGLSELANECALEISKTISYLQQVRVFDRQDNAIVTAVLCLPQQVLPSFSAACTDQDNLHYVAHAEEHLWPRTAPIDAPDQCPTLLLTLARAYHASLRHGFAGPDLTLHYDRWQASRGLGWITSALCGALLIMASFDIASALQARSRSTEYQQQIAQLNAELQSLRASLPPAPSSPENLKASAAVFQQALAQRIEPLSLLQRIAAAMTGFPDLELTQLRWAWEKPVDPNGQPDTNEVFVISVRGRILTQTGTSPTLPTQANTRTEALFSTLAQSLSGQIVARKLPYDAAPQMAIAGSRREAEQSDARPEFSVTLNVRQESGS